jgi:mono/diheme cytochrome c family protein
MKKHIVVLPAVSIAILFLLAVVTTVGASPHPQDDQVAHGKYIATIAGCTSCHTPYKAEYNQPPENLTLEQIQNIAFDERAAHDPEKLLAGGRVFDLGPAGMVFTRNLTPDQQTGIGAWTDDQIKLAIKTGIDDEGKVLFPVMPYHVYSGMADADLEAVIAYLHSVKAVSNQVPDNTVSTEGLPTPPYQTGIVAPPASDIAARGAYLVNSVMGCTDCHTPVDPATGAPLMDKYLAGRQPYEGPWGIVYGGNITPHEETGIGTWTNEEVKRSIVSGIGQDGRRLILMPWFAYSALTAEDADAVVYYLKNVLPAVESEIPAAALNPDFNVMASGEPEQLPAESGTTSPLVLWVVAGGIVLLVTLIWLYARRKASM